jgi:hypothetical protein
MVPELTDSEWKAVWHLLYNVSTNNLYLDRETNRFEMFTPDDDMTCMDPLSIEQLRELRSICEKVGAVIFPRDRP